MNITITSIAGKISGLPGYIFILACLALVLIFGYLDLTTGYEISFSIFYLIPVIIASWYIGKNAALAISTFSASSWYLADIHSGHTYSHQLIQAWNAIISLMIFLLVAITIHKLRMMIEREKELSQIDTLTGSYNRKYLFNALNNQLEMAKRLGFPITLTYVDIDNFKAINDTLGHKAGDSILVHFVDTVKKNMRIIDSIARIGGDEFIILFPNVSREEIRNILERILSDVRAILDDNRWTLISFSMGVITCRDCSLSADELIEKADTLMYEVKKTGKNGIIYSET